MNAPERVIYTRFVECVRWKCGTDGCGVKHSTESSAHRCAEATAMRRSGFKYAQIGDRLGISMERARQICAKAGLT